MELFEAIRTRRSVRKFESEPIAEEDIRDILAAAMSAPSAGNAQPWHFVVIDDKNILEEIPKFSQYAQMAPKAPLAILVCADLSLEKFPGYWVQDCSAATQNLLLAAHAKGLGAVWTGSYPMPDRVEGFRKLFNLPENVIPLALVVLGKPAQHPKPEDRYKQERVHKNGW